LAVSVHPGAVRTGILNYIFE